MKKTVTLIFVVLSLAGCRAGKPEAVSAAEARAERHLKNVTQLTFDGDNGEAYFSWDGKKLVWASNRNPGKPHETDIFIADWEE